MEGAPQWRQDCHLLRHCRRLRFCSGPSHLLLHQAAPTGPQGVQRRGDQVRLGADGDAELADRVEEEGWLPARQRSLGRWHLDAFNVYSFPVLRRYTYYNSASGEAERAVRWIRGGLSPSTRGWSRRWTGIPLRLHILPLGTASRRPHLTAILWSRR